ncbi:glycosyl transferase group 1 [Paenibacillus algicola]|uniref:Glycosyl transferase group 1 n=1 Tax=Paenibacillus algicola TaxID=2565926 RepID=A0A4P8XQR9_9BACL|nr:glycosyltransferase family 4 protein [Paenibacillus algicola]QCT04081.1 glycosyl transferase group 1 [Paenibacillus algicola]
MKICFVTHKVKKGDGQGRVNYEVILEAIRRGHEILIISSELCEELSGHQKVQWIQIKVGKIPTMLLKYQWFAILSSLLILIRRNSIGLLVVNGFITYARSDINCIHFVHSAWVKSPYHPYHEQKSMKSLYQYIYNKLNSRLERNALKKTRQVIAVSKQVKHELIKDAEIPNHRIAVVSNGVDLSEFYPRSLNRADFQLDDRKTYALFVGDLKSKRKNLDTVLKAVAEVKHLELLVLGYTDKSLYPNMAKQLGISERVHFLGYRKDVAQIMSLSDFFIFPSRYEACSLVILEAMASGLPIVTSNRCGGVELLNNQSAVIINDPDDFTALVRVLIDLTSDQEKLTNMAAHAREDAEEHSWDKMSFKYMQLFNQILTSKLVSKPERI